MIEEQIALLIAALDRNTEAHAHAPAGDAPTPQLAPSAVPAPVQPAAAPATPPVAAPPVVASPSNPVSAPAITLDQLKAEVTRVYQALAGDVRIMAIVTRYGGDLNTVAPEQYQNLLNEVLAL